MSDEQQAPERIWLTVFTDDRDPRFIMADWRTPEVRNTQPGDYVATRPHHKIAYVPDLAPVAQPPEQNDAHILDDERVGQELKRWQDAIRDKLIDMGAPDWKIDGAGCDSGDPLDFTLAEVGQGCGYFIDQLEELRTSEGYWPTLRDRGDGVRGHYCIGRLMEVGKPYWEYWNKGKWTSAGEVFVGREAAQAELDKIAAAIRAAKQQ